MAWAAACLGALLALWPAPAPASGESISARASRPMPLIMPLDYPLARARAWLGALQGAADTLAAAQPRSMADLDQTGRLALAAQIYRPMRVAPESSLGPELWLELTRRQAGPGQGEADDPFASAREAARSRSAPWQQEAILTARLENELLALRIEILRETQLACARLEALWPRQSPGPDYLREQLEPLAARLDALFRLDALLPDSLGEWLASPSDLAQLEPLAATLPDLAGPSLLLAEAQLQAGQPQASAEHAQRALRIAREREDAALAARGAYVRGMAHWRLQRLALAENDLRQALQDLDALEDARIMKARYFTARASLRLERMNREGMCEDMAAACAQGDCRGLLATRDLCPLP